VTREDRARALLAKVATDFRPVVRGEDARAGRWWWETAVASECGIHFASGGRVVRERAKAA